MNGLLFGSPATISGAIGRLFYRGRHIGRRMITRAVVITALIALTLWFHSWSLDGFRGLAFGVLFDEDTSYANGYSNRSFRRIRVGMTKEQVEALVGLPLGETWSYEVTRPRQRCTSVHVRNGQVKSFAFSDCEQLGIRIGMPVTAASSHLGAAPDIIYWLYSESPSSTHYRERVVRFSRNHVIGVDTGWYFD